MKKFSYQRGEKPFGGKLNEEASLNDIGMMMRVGTISHSTISVAKTPRMRFEVISGSPPGRGCRRG